MKYPVFQAIGICLLAVSFAQGSTPVKKHFKFSEKTTLIGTEEYTLEVGDKPGKLFYAFRGVKYAEAERWTDPKLHELTKPSYDATKFGDYCAQFWVAENKFGGSEDCLFLNVYTPKLQENGGSEKGLLPVLFYIHGGGYVLGSSNAIGPGIFLKHDVILVTINYRLGAFGYLSSGTKDLPGNYGALDMVVALEWVQKHISKFGGSPSNVVVFGHSAGSGATHVLTMSPRSLGKYHKAVLHSATALAPWVVDKHPEQHFQDFVSESGCKQGTSTSALIKCLKSKSTAELFQIQAKSIDFWLLPIYNNHVVDRETRGVDKAFLLEHPKETLSKGTYHNVPMMAGVVPDEGLMPYGFFHAVELEKFHDQDYFKSRVIPRVVKSIIPYGFKSKDVARISREVLKHYFPGDKFLKTAEDRISRIIDIYGDTMFYANQWETLQNYADHSHDATRAKVFSFIITHRGKESPNVMWKLIEGLRAAGVEHKSFDSSVCHIDDMFYLFNPCELFPSDPNHKMSEEDMQFAEYLTGLWVAFANDGTPAKGVDRAGGFPEWKPLEYWNVNYYNLTSVPAPMGAEFRPEESKFWKRMFLSLDPKGESLMKDEL